MMHDREDACRVAVSTLRRKLKQGRRTRLPGPLPLALGSILKHPRPGILDVTLHHYSASDSYMQVRPIHR